jgi:hypothetical protein
MGQIVSFLVMIIIMLIGYFAGLVESETRYQKRCEEKYSDMPHNKVTGHCKQILKFEKDNHERTN